MLLGWLSSANWVYDSPLNNFLEIFFLGNLGLTTAAVSFNMSNGKNSPAAIYLSTSVAFATLMFVILYHIYRHLVLTRLGSKLSVKVTNGRDNLSGLIPSASSHNEVTSTTIDLNLPHQYKYNLHTAYELKEPLLEDDNSI